MHHSAASPDGVPIAFEDHGTGSPALVLVHGWSCDRTYWRGQAELARRHRVVTIDLAGHGESGTGRASWTMPAFGGDVAAVVEQLGLGDVVLVGHSMGGDVIVEAALRLRGRVRGLVWVDTYPALGTPSPEAEIDAFVEPFKADFAGRTDAFVRSMFTPASDPALVDFVAADMASAPPAIALDAMRYSFANERAAAAGLGRLGLPTVSISPDDREIDVASLEAHGVRSVVLDGVGHFLMLEDPARFNRVLEEVVAAFGPP
ncbi:MAG TPA: alpha/beta hydrolase [Candidatus Limnocylindrales bacterium]|nr:alpha/beta hydrolase [Candidatus Limnocylindrales bacterium]